MTHTLPKKKRPPSTIETERLLLRTPSIEDAFALRDLATADEAFANATVGQASSTLDSACTAIIRMLGDRQAGTGSWWVVTQKDTGAIIGLTGFSARYVGHGPITALATDALGQGFAREVIESLILSSSPMPRLHESFNEASTRTDEHQQAAAPIRWYWQNKPMRSAKRGSQRCA